MSSDCIRDSEMPFNGSSSNLDWLGELYPARPPSNGSLALSPLPGKESSKKESKFMIVLALCGCNTMLWFLSCTAWKVTTPLSFIKECPAMICRYLYFFSSSLTPLSTSGNQPHPLYFNLGVSHTYEASPEISRTAPIWRGPGVSRPRLLC